MTASTPPNPQHTPHSPQNRLEDFDLPHLLSVLAAAQQTGCVQVQRGAQTFQAWVVGGRVRQATGPYNLRGPAAFAELMRDQQGTFLFKAGEVPPSPDLDLSVDAFSYQALLLLSAPPIPFRGPGSLVSVERLDELGLSREEIDILEDVDLGFALTQLGKTAAERDLLGRLCRIGLIKQRKIRVARVVVKVDTSLFDEGVIDEAIYQAWCKAKGEKLSSIQMRLENGRIYQVPITPRYDQGAFVTLAPDVLLRTGLYVGEAVYLRPTPFSDDGK